MWSDYLKTLPCGVCEMLWGMMLLVYQLVELQERCGYHQDTRLARISAPHCGLQQVCVWGGGVQEGGGHLGFYHFITFKWQENRLFVILSLP